MIVCGCALTCYFSACNIAIKTFNRTRLMEVLAERSQSHRLELLHRDQDMLPLLIGTVRTAMNFIILLSVLRLMERRSDLHEPYVSAVSFLIAATLAVLFSVGIPTSWARYQPERLLAWSIPLFNVAMRLFKPIVVTLHLVDPIVRRISGADSQESEENAASEEILSVVAEHESEGAVDQVQKEMIEAVFDLPNMTAGEIMTPRTDIEGIEITANIETIKKAIMEAGHSRIPVYDDTIDNIVGILYAKDLIRFLNSAGGEKFDLKTVLRAALMVPESKSVRSLLSDFRDKKVHIAIVLDEYGGTAGLVTIEDIIEELVGEIQDEYEPAEEEPNVRKVDENTADVDARVYIDDVNDALGLSLPEDEDYDTVGGFVFSTLGHIPQVGEVFEFENIRVTVTGAERTKVTQVRIERIETATANDNGGSGK